MIYQCLAEDTREIRLLKLLPNEDFNAKVECLIYKVSLQSGPSYVALSYAWGDPEIKASILVNGTELMVTTNLESGLRQIRQSCNESSFWIDAICIDQTNLDERTHQVRLMREIYSNVEVLVWLGIESDDSDVAMNALAYWLFRYVQRDNKRSIIPHVVGSLNPQEWQALQKLIERPWWTRLWCLQELVLAKEVSVLCGSKLLSWTCFFILQMIVEGIQKSSYGKLGYQGRAIVDPRDFGMLDEKVAIRLNHLPPNGKGDLLLSLLYVSQTLENSEPLDKVYALLGIARDSSDFDSPDYTRSTSTVYTNVARTIIQRDHDLSVIASGGIVQSTRDMGGNNIPSWVPDWSQGNNKWHFSLVLWSYCAAKDTTAITWFISAPKPTLFAKGIIYDEITRVEKPIRDTLFGLKVVERVECLVQRILLAVGGPGSYVTGIPRLQAFFSSNAIGSRPH
jgi:hypothetical protein